MIGSLARLEERLTGRKMDQEDRRNPDLVVAALKQGLQARARLCLLCLDNAYDSTVGGIVNEVCKIAWRSAGEWVDCGDLASRPASCMERDDE